MKIKTITCHNVYNVGASLQAYALVDYLKQRGHDVEIIDYNPYYLRHYELFGVKNPRFDKPILREIYQLLKFPKRFIRRLEKRKKIFDDFTATYLPKTENEYNSNKELKANIPEADIYIAGSDQIWNPLFKNGKDPAFFLDFVPDTKKKISYAASFAVDEIEMETKTKMQKYLKRFQGISVREESGVALVQQMGLEGVQVCDPVFLLSLQKWEKLRKKELWVNKNNCQKYLLVYDFDSLPQIAYIATKLSKRYNLKLHSVFPMKEADKIEKNMGPIEFLNAVANAQVILSNSFHATAFSLIFHKEFYVVNRQENINTRMRDLLKVFELEERLISLDSPNFYLKEIDWMKVDLRIKEQKKVAQNYLSIYIS